MTHVYWRRETNVTAVTALGTVRLHINARVTLSRSNTNGALNTFHICHFSTETKQGDWMLWYEIDPADSAGKVQ